jgi:outer membrane protein TolC
LRAELRAQEESLQFSRRNLELTTEQYRAGTVSYLNVVIAQTVVLNSELSVLGVRNRELVATNQLLKNIAGRWE